MKLRASNTPTVDYETAKRRAIACIAETSARGALAMSATVADAIWPGHNMTAQGAGGAAGRILRRMQREGLLEWEVRGSLGNPTSWGWRIR